MLAIKWSGADSHLTYSAASIVSDMATARPLSAALSIRRDSVSIERESTRTNGDQAGNRRPNGFGEWAVTARSDLSRRPQPGQNDHQHTWLESKCLLLWIPAR